MDRLGISQRTPVLKYAFSIPPGSLFERVCMLRSQDVVAYVSLALMPSFVGLDELGIVMLQGLVQTVSLTMQ